MNDRNIVRDYFVRFRRLRNLQKLADYFGAKERGWLGAARDNAIAIGGARVACKGTKHVVSKYGFGRMLTDESTESLKSHTKIIEDWLRKKGIEPKIMVGPQHKMMPDVRDLSRSLCGAFATPGPWISSIAGVPEDTIHSSRQSPGILMHEAGHVANYHGLRRMFGHNPAAIGMMSRTPLARLGALAGVGLGAVAGKDTSAGENAWKIPLVLGTPLVAEEATATLRGLNALRRIQGLKVALRHAPRPLVGLAAYGMLPLSTSVAASLMNRWKPDARPVQDNDKQLTFLKKLLK